MSLYSEHRVIYMYRPSLVDKAPEVLKKLEAGERQAVSSEFPPASSKFVLGKPGILTKRKAQVVVLVCRLCICVFWAALRKLTCNPAAGRQQCR